MGKFESKQTKLRPHRFENEKKHGERRRAEISSKLFGSIILVSGDAERPRSRNHSRPVTNEGDILVSFPLAIDAADRGPLSFALSFAAAPNGAANE